MAGLGFKDFQVGEVLTSADVDGYLMQQSVMRFADAGARGSALGTAVGTGVPLAEGMVAYLDSLDAVQVFDGTDWLTVVAPGTAVTPVNGSMLQYGTATADYAPTAGPMFKAVEANVSGSIAIVGVANGDVTVTFTSGRFSTTPVVTLGLTGVVAQDAAAWITALSSTGFTVRIRNGEGAQSRTYNVRWIAVEMP